eukprot:3768992-Pleurochrysis_carterae.AAC.1
MHERGGAGPTRAQDWQTAGGEPLPPDVLPHLFPSSPTSADLQTLCPTSKRRVVAFVAGESGDRMASLTRHGPPKYQYST